jgi:thiol-disulfide isomerase/thioredoxin
MRTAPFPSFILTISSCALLLSLFVSSCGQTEDHPTEETADFLSDGRHRMEMTVNDSLILPFNFDWKEVDGQYNMSIFNGEEEIRLTEIRWEEGKDTLRIQMPVFLSYFKLAKSPDGVKGYWYNPDKDPNYRVAVRVKEQDSLRFDVVQPPAFSLNYNWKVSFIRENRISNGLGEFVLEGGKAHGSILTETGDYRFLEGVLDGDRLYMSTFDGAHAYLFAAKVIGPGLIEGQYFSGNHFHIPWKAERDDAYTLREPDELSRVTTKEGNFPFAFIDLEGAMVTHEDERFAGKPHIIQIMGSWCPNCMDETRFFNQLYSSYHKQGLEIVGISFERKEDMAEVRPALDRMIADLAIQYPVLFGGSLDSVNARLPQIDQFMSFPTSFFVDRHGKVRKVHTGFSGPGTSRYDAYVQETKAFVEDLLAE